MSDIAERAQVSAATAYRHFGSVDEVLSEFRYQVGLHLLEFSRQQRSAGLELLRAVSVHWVHLVVNQGLAMVHTRSQEGYLMRLRDGTRYLTVQADALSRPIAEAADQLGVKGVGDHGLFLWNILFDPREILDLMAVVGLDEDEVGRRLVAAFCGALGGWAKPTTAPVADFRDQ